MNPEHSAHQQPESGNGIPQTNFRRPVYCLLGLLLDAVSPGEAIGRISAASTSRPCFLSTPNVHFLVASQSDPGFRDSIIRSDLSIADGMPLIWIASLLGMPIRKRVAGSDLFESFMNGKGRALKVYFFGGPDGAAEAASNRMNAMSGPMRCVGFASPGFGTVEQMSDPRIISDINHSGADLVAVAVGVRKGQVWIERNRDALEAPVISYLGAMVNFVAGSITRAPVLMRKLGLEWAWRIKEEPVLWRRYAGDALALSRLVATKVLPALAQRALRAPQVGEEPARIQISRGSESIRLIVSGNWSAHDLPLLQEGLETITLQPAGIELDMSGLERIGAGFIGLLMLLYGHQSKLRRTFRIVSISQRAQRALRLNCAEFLLNASDGPG